jgi:hypothetical protein
MLYETKKREEILTADSMRMRATDVLQQELDLTGTNHVVFYRV